jgi:hypothetical protein
MKNLNIKTLITLVALSLVVAALLVQIDLRILGQALQEDLTLTQWVVWLVLNLAPGMALITLKAALKV